MRALLRGEPPPEGTTREQAASLIANHLMAARFPLPVARWWRDFGDVILADWSGPGRPWGELEAQDEHPDVHPNRHRGMGCWVRPHPRCQAWMRLARPDYRNRTKGAAPTSD